MLPLRPMRRGAPLAPSARPLKTNALLSAFSPLHKFGSSNVCRTSLRASPWLKVWRGRVCRFCIRMLPCHLLPKARKENTLRCRKRGKISLYLSALKCHNASRFLLPDKWFGRAPPQQAGKRRHFGLDHSEERNRGSHGCCVMTRSGRCLWLREERAEKRTAATSEQSEEKTAAVGRL